MKSTWYAFTRPSDLPVPASAISQRWKELWVTRQGQPNRFVGQWIRDNLPPGSIIAAEQCGIIPYISGAKTIDIFGLMTPAMARIPITDRSALLMSMDVEYILLAFSFEPSFPTFIPNLFEREDFQQRYCLKAILVSCNYRVGIPGYVLFERKDSKEMECRPPPLLGSDEEILAWLKNSIEKKSTIACWGYADDVFR